MKKRTRPRKEQIYFILERSSNLLKIGKSVDVARRIETLQTATPHELTAIGTLNVADGFQEEFLHSQFDALHVRGEWFKFEGILLEFIKEKFEARNGAAGWVFTDHGPVVTMGNLLSPKSLAHSAPSGLSTTPPSPGGSAPLSRGGL